MDMKIGIRSYGSTERSRLRSELVFAFGVSLWLGAYPFCLQRAAAADVPGLRGLSAEEIVFRPIIGVETSNSIRDTEELTARATSKLKHAGIEAGVSEIQQGGRRPPELVLTLLAKKIEGCKDKLLHMKSLELTEDAVRKREPKFSSRVVIFGGASLYSEIIQSDSQTLERFRHDLDLLLDRFILSYRSAN
jgi:hypothetical protein